MSDKKAKEMKVTVVDYETFSDYLFVPVSTFFVRGATGDYYFFHTSKRAEAQKQADEMFGKNKYKVVASRLQKEKSKSESGALSCNGTATRSK